MFRQRRGPFLASVLAVVALAVLPARTSARGEDVCPESNDTVQSACFLGTASDALGFISRDSDVDVYRFEIRDYAAVARVEIPDRPLPYRVRILNWRGEDQAVGADGVAQAQLDVPGSYFAIVDAPTGEFSDTEPYRVVHSVTYPSASVPTRLYATEFRGGPTDVFTATGTARLSDEVGDYAIESGRIAISLRNPGTREEPVSSKFTLSPDPPDPGPIVTDFTMAIDVQASGGTDVGYTIVFRHVDEQNFYQLDAAEGNVVLSKVVNGEIELLTEWVPVPGFSITQTNRTIIRCVGDDIRVNLNGEDVLHARDDALASGLIGFGVVTWGDPPTVTFDNILVTTPTDR